MAQPLKLGVAGLGTVGGGVVKLIGMHGARLAHQLGRPVVITGVCARDKSRDRGIDVTGFEWFDDPVALAISDNTDVFVELIGGEDGPARASVEAALEAGKHVVTANKALIAVHGHKLAELAERNGVALNFEAGVAGGIPIVKAMRESLVSNKVNRVVGILNGTCNYILTTMEQDGTPFEDVLKDAQELGYAEADPTFDIGGFDAAHKLAILTSLAFGTQVAFDAVYVEGIEKIEPVDFEAADELGFRVKLLGVALETDSGIEQRVHPCLVPKSSPIARVSGVTNCVVVDAEPVGQIMLVGPGAGEGATASSVVADIVDVARGLIVPPLSTKASDLKPYERARMRAHAGGYYVRLSVFDRPGSFAAIANRMAEQGVSLDSIVQKRRDGGAAQTGADKAQSTSDAQLPVILVTHETTEKAIRDALAAIEQDGHVAAPTTMIRIERL